MKTRILFLSAAAIAVQLGMSAASADENCYDDCYPRERYQRYDDQAEATRELNLMQLENPGAGEAAVPGTPYNQGDYGDDDRRDDRGYGNRYDDRAYPDEPEDGDWIEPPDNDGEPYDDEDQDGEDQGGPYDDDR